MIGWFGGLASQAMAAVSQGNPVAIQALFVLVCLSEMGVPFPLVLDTILFLVGYGLAGVGGHALLLILVTLLAREMGSAAVYWLSHFLGRPLVNRLRKRYPALLINLQRVTKKLGVEAALVVVMSRLGIQTRELPGFDMRLSFTVATARITPGLLTATSVASGIFGLRYGYFVLGIALASVLTDVLIILLGVVTGYWLVRLGFYPSAWLVVIGLVVNISLLWLARRIIRRRRHH